MLSIFYAIKLTMQNVKSASLIFLLMFNLLSCGRERLTSAYQPVTINELKHNSPIYFSYKIDDTQIDEYAKNAGKFPLFGKLFQAIAIVLANTSISTSGGHELKLPPVDVDLSSLSAIDFNLIDYISFDSLMVTVKDAKAKDSLNFVDRLEIYGKFDSPIPGMQVDNEGFARLVYFDLNETPLGCDGTCLKLNISNLDWKKILMSNKLVHLRPKLVINSVPVSTMKLAGSIEFSVKFNLGF